MSAPIPTEKQVADLKLQVAALQQELAIVNAAAPDGIRTLAQAKAALGVKILKIVDLTSERDRLLENAKRSAANIGILERICKLKGISPEQAVPNLEEPERILSSKYFEQKLLAAKTPEERSLIMKEFQLAHDEKRLAL